MKTPIKNPNSHVSALRELKKIIQPGAVVNSFFFYCGSLEFALSNTDRFIVGHPSNIAVHEFWECLLKDSSLVHEIVVSAPFLKLRHERIIAFLQEKWIYYKDPFVRAALFYTLNQFSKNGKVSSGILDDDPQLFNDWKLSTLKKFKATNFHLAECLGDSDWKSKPQNNRVDYNVYNLGFFQHNLLRGNTSGGIEESQINHREVCDYFHNSCDSPSILLYKKHPQILKLYSKHNIILIGKRGTQVKNLNDCEDIIVTNF